MGNKNVYNNTSYCSMAKIIAVCKSEEKGTRKEAVVEGIFAEDYRLVGDAHADCCTHRQVSLVSNGRMNACTQAWRIATDGK